VGGVRESNVGTRKAVRVAVHSLAPALWQEEVAGNSWKQPNQA
jgi:hypothetical protein